MLKAWDQSRVNKEAVTNDARVRGVRRTAAGSAPCVDSHARTWLRAAAQQAAGQIGVHVELDVTQLRHMLYVFQPAESDSHYADSEGDPGVLTLPTSSCQIASATPALHCAYMVCAALSPPMPTAATLRSVSAATCS
jgi:hypothetical protein